MIAMLPANLRCLSEIAAWAPPWPPPTIRTSKSRDDACDVMLEHVLTMAPGGSRALWRCFANKRAPSHCRRLTRSGLDLLQGVRAQRFRRWQGPRHGRAHLLWTEPWF